MHVTGERQIKFVAGEKFEHRGGIDGRLLSLILCVLAGKRCEMVMDEGDAEVVLPVIISNPAFFCVQLFAELKELGLCDMRYVSNQVVSDARVEVLKLDRGGHGGETRLRRVRAGFLTTT